MAQVVYHTPWIGDNFFATANPRDCTLTAVEIVPGKRGDDYIIELNSEARMSVFGTNLKTLIDKAGGTTESWEGAHVRIAQTTIDGKKRRLLVVLQKK